MNKIFYKHYVFLDQINKIVEENLLKLRHLIIIVNTNPEKDKNSEIITYCWNKDCTAGATLANRLVALGYTNVKHYKGGIVEWKENKKPFTETQPLPAEAGML